MKKKYSITALVIILLMQIGYIRAQQNEILEMNGSLHNNLSLIDSLNRIHPDSVSLHLKLNTSGLVNATQILIEFTNSNHQLVFSKNLSIEKVNLSGSMNLFFENDNAIKMPMQNPYTKKWVVHKNMGSQIKFIEVRTKSVNQEPSNALIYEIK